MAQTPLSIIRYDGGDNNVLVYRSEIRDFNTESVLIVDESQQALLYKDGQAEGPFKSGRYVLPTNNLPKFRGLFAKLFSRKKEADGSTPFTCDVYFVNMVNDVLVDWGTPTRIMVKDPVYNELVNIGANGSLKVKVSDAMRFVVSVNGRMGGYSLERLTATLRSEILTVLKTNLSDCIINGKVSLLEIQPHLLELSTRVERKLNERLSDYGLTAVHFNVEDVSVDAESQQRLLERQRKINARSDVVLDSQAQTDADYMRTVRMADAKAKEREIQGYTYQDEKYWQTQQEMAKNPSMGYRPAVPPVPPAGMVPPMGYPAYPAYAGMQPYPPYGGYGANMYGGGAFCARCGQPLQPGTAFCAGCGTPVQVAQPQGQPSLEKGHSYTQSAQRKNCPKCGFPLTPRAMVCPNCDYDLTGDGDEE